MKILKQLFFLWGVRQHLNAFQILDEKLLFGPKRDQDPHADVKPECVGHNDARSRTNSWFSRRTVCS